MLEGMDAEQETKAQELSLARIREALAELPSPRARARVLLRAAAAEGLAVASLLAQGVLLALAARARSHEEPPRTPRGLLQ